MFFVVEIFRRRSRELKEREKEQVANEPEADPERDQRTVFAYQVNAVNLFHTFMTCTALQPVSFCSSRVVFG
jgi:hypothetical protein